MVWPDFPAPLSSIVSDMTYSTRDHSFLHNEIVSNTVQYHCLNQVVQIVVPVKNDVQSAKELLQAHFPRISSMLSSSRKEPAVLWDPSLKYFRIIQSPIHLLLHRSFIESYILTGSLFVLSECQHVDRDDCLTILPTGVMHLSLRSHSYHRLGVVGNESILNAKKSPCGKRFVITIDLKDPLITSKFEKQKYYIKLFNSFQNSGLKMDLLVRWIPDSVSFKTGTISTHSIRQFFDHVKANPEDGIGFMSDEDAKQMKIESCSPTVRRFENRNQFIPNTLLKLSGVVPNDDGIDEILDDAQDWIGSQLCSLPTVVRNSHSLDVNSFGFEKGSCQSLSSVLCGEAYGFFTPSDVMNLLKEYDDNVELIGDQMPFMSITVSGFENSPISWSYGERAEHGKDLSGENSYSILLTCKPHVIPSSLTQRTIGESGAGDACSQSMEVIRKTLIWRRADAFDFSIQRL